MVVAAIVVAGILWLLRYRLQERLIRAYGLFFLILLFFVVNKGEGSTVEDLAAGTFSPLGMARWGLLGIVFVLAMRERKPEGYRSDTSVGIIAGIFLCNILISTVYASDFTYSFMRGASFILLAVAILIGFTRHFYLRVNCVKFFRLHYYIAWLVLVPAMLLHLAGLDRFGASIVMGQYAGPFGNQNLFGVFSGLITPYVLFHWRNEAKSKRQWWTDVALLTIILLGLALSKSRGGMLACIIAISVYFFIINLESRIRIFAAAVCLMIAFIFFPNFQQSLTSFIRKDTVERAQIEGIGQQFYEERRYELWSGVLPLYWKEKLTGYGFAMSHLLTFPFSGDKEVGRHVHNSYLELFGDLGLPGVILLLLMLSLVVARSVTLIQRREHYLQHNINAVFISIFIAGSVNAFFESWMFSVGNIITVMFWVPIAGIVAQSAWKPVTAKADAEKAPSKTAYPALQPQTMSRR